MQEYQDLLEDAVNSGGGMGFAAPLQPAVSAKFWHGAARDVEDMTRIVLTARFSSELVGSAQLELCTKSNGLHRAEVQKVMVHSRFRRRGLGRALMEAVDAEALSRGRTTLILDTWSHDHARRLYERAGWTHAGDIPCFATTLDGSLASTSIYYRLLR